MRLEIDVELIAETLASLPEDVQATIELPCENCGVVSVDVRPGMDPYLHELFDMETWVLLCSDCFKERSDDI